MSILEIILLGIGLAMDCFAVSISTGLSYGKFNGKGASVMAASFGIFQAGMPLVGYLAGSIFSSFISRVAPWVALLMLEFIGGKMVVEHFSDKKGESVKRADYSIGTILALSVATSIDALATGVLFVGMGGTIWSAIAIIGACSFIFSFSGTAIGVFAGKKFSFPSELLGGLILIGIGLKIWLEGII